MTDLAKMTWEEARDLFVPQAVAILPVASTEPHGPHLPLDTDVTIALAQARRAVRAWDGRTAPVRGLPCRAVTPLQVVEVFGTPLLSLALSQSWASC